ncbi:hypothetical protein H0H92_014211 [Tricholoma furcatifolium]|nr:hypothetical protein H0H92_014211 [Tricholoma furcatifolium]
MAPSTSNAAPDKKKGKGKADTLTKPDGPKRVTRQSSFVTEPEPPTGEPAVNDGIDAVDYKYSDAYKPEAVVNDVLISVLPASPAATTTLDSAHVHSGDTLDSRDDQGYLSPDTEEAIAAAVLSGGIIDTEEDH